MNLHNSNDLSENQARDLTKDQAEAISEARTQYLTEAITEDKTRGAGEILSQNTAPKAKRVYRKRILKKKISVLNSIGFDISDLNTSPPPHEAAEPSCPDSREGRIFTDFLRKKENTSAIDLDQEGFTFIEPEVSAPKPQRPPLIKPAEIVEGTASVITPESAVSNRLISEINRANSLTNPQILGLQEDSAGPKLKQFPAPSKRAEGPIVRPIDQEPPPLNSSPYGAALIVDSRNWNRNLAQKLLKTTFILSLLLLLAVLTNIYQFLKQPIPLYP